MKGRRDEVMRQGMKYESAGRELERLFIAWPKRNGSPQRHRDAEEHGEGQGIGDRGRGLGNGTKRSRYFRMTVNEGRMRENPNSRRLETTVYDWC
jgi:hypothetical protein